MILGKSVNEVKTSEKVWSSKLCEPAVHSKERGIKHAPKFQNGGRVEWNKTKFVQFNFKYHGKAWLPNDDTGTGRQRNNLVDSMVSAFSIWLFLLLSDSRHSLVYVKQRCRSWSGKLVLVDCYTLLLLSMIDWSSDWFITFERIKPLPGKLGGGACAASFPKASHDD